MGKTLVVIDGKSVLYRGYYAMGNLATPAGKPTGATYGFAMMGLRIMSEFQPDYIVVAWDKSKTNIRARRRLYAEYKAQRKPMPDDLREQIEDVHRLCEAFGWPLLEIDDFEADDIMGTLARQAKEKGIDSVLITSDLDVLQLVNHHTKVCALKRGLTQTVLYDQERLQDEFGMTPEQFVDYKALRGDPSDNIPGVKGVGDKTARQLIHDHDSLDAVYEHLADISPTTVRKLEADKEMAFLSRELIKLSLEVPVEFDEVAANARVADPAAIGKLFDELNFQRLKKDLPEWMRSEQQLFTGEIQEIAMPSVHTVSSEKDLSDIQVDSPVMIYMYERQEDGAPGLVLSPSREHAYYIPDPGLLPAVRKRLADCLLVGHEMKPILRWLMPDGSLWDIKVAAFLLDPLQRSDELSELTERVLGYHMQTADEDEVHIASVVAALWQLQDSQASAFEKLPLLSKVMREIEMPLLPVLSRIEERGIKLDVEYLQAMSDDFTQRIRSLKSGIYKEAGQEFNINSPQQLQSILFDTLLLDTTNIKKTKKGYSTGASELEKLRSLHPIIDMITHYRELTKLKSTYIDALPKLVGKDMRLHTTFTQTVTQTGRLSSLHPNLQNIPVRTEEGRAIRSAFIAETEMMLVQADYSQIELRIAAALSGDEKMIAAFNEGADIHQQTAAELHGIRPEEVTKEQRYSAKTVNFGVLYGMSPHGLSVATGMTREDAKAFIDRYFDIRSQLLAYLEELKRQAKSDGYVSTWFGRRRPMPDIHSSNFAVRAAAERAAMNMPIQGTAADIMKLAMIELEQRLDSDNKQILQVHDSVLIECPDKNAEAVARQCRDIMKGVVDELPVILEVETATGRHWGEL